MQLPLSYQIICIILTALFFFAFSVAREPRGWRRLFQSWFASSADFSVNRNKVIDENLKRYGIIIAMLILVADVGIFVWGLSEKNRRTLESMTPDQIRTLNEIQKINGQNGASGARDAIGR